MDLDKATLKIDRELKAGKHSPVLHVLMPDGRTEEFRDRGIVLPEGDDRVFALLINDKAEPFRTPDGQLAIIAVPVVGLHMNPDPSELLEGWKAVARYIGVSVPTAKRRVKDGRLPKPVNISDRRVAFQRGEVDAAVAKMKGE